MLFMMVSLTSRVGIKIGLFPTEFRPKSFFGKQVRNSFKQLHKKWLCATGTPSPFVQQLVWGNSIR